MTDALNPAVITVRGVSHHYGKSLALDGIDLELPAGKTVGLIGPDGVGKSTLMGLIAGSRIIQQGTVEVLGGSMADHRHRDAVCPRIAYMPQGLGKNLYKELSVFENIDFFARLFGQGAAERNERISTLLEATGLGPFPERLAGRLSGGMKQKLSLCCSLVHDPDLLILDEPTTGVDPVSRRQFWRLIDRIRKSRPGMSVLISTAYMDEAEQFEWTVAMDAGRILSTGTPAELRERTGGANLEEVFVALLPEAKRGRGGKLVVPPMPDTGGEIAISAKDLTMRFGAFTAVDSVSFEIAKGEIFGFLGSNGCGKSTTMKMLTGLLAPTEGEARLFGNPVEAGSVEIRNRVGYMSQAFSLYGELTVMQNLALHARLYHLPPDRQRPRIAELVEMFGLGPYVDHQSEALPLGLRQRLSLAVAIIHEPELLILDEPTSGVDPVARDEFWEVLIDLSRNRGITIFVSTHFMNEAMRCDRISLMHAGKVLACDAPAALVATRGVESLEEAFIGYIVDAGGDPEASNPADADEGLSLTPASVQGGHPQGRGGKLGFSPGRLRAYAHLESMEIRRDPVRLAFAFLGSALLMLVFGFGITTDVEDIRIAEFDQDQSPESRAYVESFSASRSFLKLRPASSAGELQARLESNDISAGIEIPPMYGRDLRRGSGPEVSAVVDGANPFRAETIKQYLEGTNRKTYQDFQTRSAGAIPPNFVSDIQARFAYNPNFESIATMAPSIPAILLILIPAILTAVSVTREKELGSIINFYVTPTTSMEYLIGKQLPYIVIAMINFVIMTTMSYFVFDVPIKGNGLMLAVCALLYVTVTTSIGLLIATFTGSQVAAVLVTAIVTMVPSIQFSGMMQPVSTLQGMARVNGTLWPTTYYMLASVEAFTKGAGARQLAWRALALAAFIPVLTAASVKLLKRQEA